MIVDPSSKVKVWILVMYMLAVTASVLEYFSLRYAQRSWAASYSSTRDWSSSSRDWQMYMSAAASSFKNLVFLSILRTTLTFFPLASLISSSSMSSVIVSMAAISAHLKRVVSTVYHTPFPLSLIFMLRNHAS